jgi:hypothetical protein
MCHKTNKEHKRINDNRQGKTFLFNNFDIHNIGFRLLKSNYLFSAAKYTKLSCFEPLVPNGFAICAVGDLRALSFQVAGKLIRTTNLETCCDTRMEYIACWQQ